MTREPVSITSDLSLGEALGVMVRHGIKHLPVLEHGRPTAMLSGPELLGQLLKIQEQGRPLAGLAQQPVTDFCGSYLPVTPETDSQQVMVAFERGANCLPVIEQDRLVGMVSMGNMLRFIASQITATPLHDERHVNHTRLDVLLNVVRQISTSRDQNRILEVACAQLLNVMPVDRAALLLRPTPESKAYVVSVHSVRSNWDGRLRGIPFEGTLCGWVGRQRRSLRSGDLAEEERLSLEHEPWTDGQGSALTTPLMDRSDCFGVLQVWTEKPHAYLDSDLELVELVGGQVANFVLHGRRLESETRLVETLRRQDRIKDEFLAVVTHDLRNAIQGNLAYTQILLKKSADPVTQKIAKMLEETTQYMASLTNDLHDFGSLGLEALKLKTEPVDLVAQIRRTLAEHEERARLKSIQLRSGDLPDHLRLEADPVRLRQILANLISNAIKYNRPDGWVEVRVRVTSDAAFLEIEDSGIGIEPFQQQKVFELFHQVALKKKVEGSGLGLTITKRLVELHGGKLELKSQPGVGSTFTVRLPLRRRTGP